MSDFKKIYIDIAKLHISSIEDGFLSTLGENFLALLYESIDLNPKSTLIFESRNGSVVGFVAGGFGMGSIYFQMFKMWPRLLYTLIPSLLNPSKLKKIFEIIFNNFQLNPKISKYNNELFSISVLKDLHGQGVAQCLYKKLCQWFRANGVSSFKIIVGENLSRAHAFYLKMGACPVDKISVHAGNLSTLYVHELNQNN